MLRNFLLRGVVSAVRSGRVLPLFRRARPAGLILGKSSRTEEEDRT